MEQTKGSLGSQQMQIQQQQQQQQNQSKKKSKNKKKSSKIDTVASRPIDEQQQHQPSEGAMVENGLTDQIKQQLHIGSNDDKNNTNLNNSSINCGNSNNNNKVNGLMTKKLSNSSKACPPITTDIQNVEKIQSAPALNGHHHHLHEREYDTTMIGKSTTNKKSKRKPNNKKNANTSEVNSNSNHLENGHCHDMMMVTTNGFQHKQEEVEEREQQKTNDTNNTAIKANKTNATKSTNSTSSTIGTTITTPKNNNATPSRAESSEQEQQQPSAALETVSCTSQNTEPAKELDLSTVHIEYKEYESELEMHVIMRLIQAELSEPYSIYTYRYFIYNWPKLCFLAAHGNEYVGAIVCKLDMHMNVKRGYIAMLAVRKEYRKLRIGTTLVQKAIEAMLADKADEVVLETEMSNLPALRLYENLGFVRDKRLFRYYLNGVDALRLKLWFR